MPRDGNWEALFSPESSFFKIALYNVADGNLVTLLQNRLYVFAGLTPLVWRELNEAESTGAYFNKYIKERYRVYEVELK